MPNHIDNDFEAPPTIWVIAVVVGGIATGLGLIAGLEYLSDRISIKSSSMPNALIAIEVESLSNKQMLNTQRY
ncbi:MAG: hypothetical protein AAF959_19625 [Cyanobacteria bacterium P01_D01_bin.56]